MTNHRPVLAWCKSSYSNQSGGNCVETAPIDGVVGIRDSKDVTRGVIEVPGAAWALLMDGLKTA